MAGKAPAPGLTVALPTRFAVFERFTLPSTDPGELEGMVRLQLEKTLPYPVEETTHGFQILPRQEPDGERPEPGGENPPPAAESTIVACAVHNPAVEALCTPLLQARHYPERLTLWAMLVATQAPRSGVACALWQEEKEVVFAVFENGRLSFTEIVASPDDLPEQFAQVLMSAELAGAPTGFAVALLDPALAALRQPFAKAAAAPVEELNLGAVLPHEGKSGGPASPVDSAPVDLTPEAWRGELARQGRNRKFKARLGMAGMAYAAFLLIAFASLGIQKQRLARAEKDLRAVQPQVDTLIAEQTRWRSLEAAVNKSRYTVELIYQAFESLPSQDLRITHFEQSLAQFQVEGEAPDAKQAIAFGEKLKSRDGLSEFKFEAPQPTHLPNDHWQFRIYGKL